MENWIYKWRIFLSDNPILDVIEEIKVRPSSQVNIGEDDKYWKEIRELYYPTFYDLINLNNGAVSSNSSVVERAFTSYYSLLNSSPSYFTWKVMEKGREIIREGLAKLINASSDEVAIHRNATEALNNVIFGVSLQEGDEVVLSRQDYTKAVQSWKQREARDKIKLVWVDITGKETNEEIHEKYVSAFSAKTKILNLTHVINWNGQVLNVQQIIDSAKKRNIKVLLDAAHSFGLLETDVKKLNCDYFATALHKWLGGPIPSGMLYVKNEEISNLWPLASSAEPLSADIRKFEELSIQLMPNILGLGYAIELHSKLGRANKEARLRHLRRFWTEKAKEIDGLQFNTPLNEEQCCVIVDLFCSSRAPSDLETLLFEQHRVHTMTVKTTNLEGVRITPNIYTSKEELQILVDALVSICKTPMIR